MSFLPRVRRVLRIDRPDAAAHVEREVDEEIAFHIASRVRDLMAQEGLARDVAEARARAEFGDVRVARARLERPARRHERRSRARTAMGQVAGDLRYGLRGLRRDPGFAVAATLTLGLAIAASTSLFSVVRAVLLRPLPFPEPDRLALVWTGSGIADRGRADYVTADAWRARSLSFADMAFLDPVTATLTDADGAERVGVARISANFLPLLGIAPTEGRGFSPEEALSRERVALLSHGFRERHFGNGADVVGRTLELDGARSTIIGVLPAGLELPGMNGDIYEPYTLFPDWEATGNEGQWYVVGRLRPEVNLDRARTELGAISAALDASRPLDERGRGVSVTSLERHVVGDTPRTALWVLTGAALLVLLIATANVVGLSLARGIGRRREFAVRASLGAGPGRLVRQLLTEAGALALASGVAGTALAVVGIGLLRTFGPADLPRLGDAGLDPVVLAWALGLSLMAALLVGVAPAATIFRRNVRFPVSEGGRGGTAGLAARAVRRGLVVAEFAVAIVLLAGSGLLIRSWMSLSAVDPGFDPGRTLSLNLSTSAYPADAARTAFYGALLERVTAIPGVESAGLIGDFFTDGDAERTFTPEGAGAPVQVVVRVDEVSEGLFSAVGAPILSGRAFTAADGLDAPPVAIVNEALAARLFPGSEAVGRRFKNGPPDAEQPWVTIVGLVSDMRRQGLDVAPIPQSFVPLAQDPSGSETLLVRTSFDDPLDLAPAVRAAVADIDPRVPLYFLSSLDDAMGADLAQRRFQTSLLVAFALLALAMAAIGIYGLIHYSVAARRREFAIRLAVGARARDILGISIGEGLRLSAIGLGLGIPGALVVGRAGTGLLYGVSPSDPPTLASVSVVLLAVATAASLLPARRSTRIDPMEALRPE